MKISLKRLSAEAETTGFRSDMLEKVAHLLNLLDTIRSHPFLKGKLILKGGTALNLFVFDADELEHHLVPLLRVSTLREQEEPGQFGRKLIDECRQGLSTILPFTKEELEFLNHLLDEGEINPSLLTDDIGLQDRIRRHPLLAWKALNVRQYRGRS